MNVVRESVKETLQEALAKMEKGGEHGPFMAMMIGLAIDEVRYLLEEVSGTTFETAYFAGYEYGYKMAVKDMVKKLKEMKTYGGHKGSDKEKHAAGMPGV